ncbi:MAG: type II toxin-antitoxin system Phd/YefM family antitoxin [Cyanobium sp.]
MASAGGGPSPVPSGSAAPRCVNVQEAKTHLSALLVPLDPRPRRQLGFLQGCVDEAFFEPLPDEELERWG